MSERQLEEILNLDGAILKKWMDDTSETCRVISTHSGEAQCKELYQTCFDSLVKAAITHNQEELKVCVGVLTNKQLKLPSEHAHLILQMLLSFKKSTECLLDKYGNQFLISLNDCIENLSVLYVQHISQQIGQQDSRLKNMNKQLKRRVRELSVLSQSSDYINSTLEECQLLEYILSQVDEIMRTGICAIFRLDEASWLLRIIAHKGLSPEYTRKIFIPVGQDGGGKAVVTLKPVVISNVSSKWVEGRVPEHIIPVMREINYKAILSVPMVYKDRVLGCISVYNKRPYNFTKAEMSILSIFSNHAAVAIENARLYQKAQELAVIQERNRIARDLHDSVCQSMFSLMLNAETCARLMANNNSEKAKDAMAKVQSLAKDTLVEMRGLIFELRPLILKEQGLVRALESNINVFIKRNGIPVAFSYGMLKRLPEDLELCLYRVAQEALTNIMKHAAASSIEISLDFKPDTVTLTIADDGKGFDIQTVLVSQKNFGLVAMRERIEACGGQLLIDSATGRGTIVKAQISMGGRVCESN